MARQFQALRGAGRNLRTLALFAQAEGWTISRTDGGHLKFTKPGRPTIYTSFTASDRRAELNARSRLRRADRQAELEPGEPPVEPMP